MSGAPGLGLVGVHDREEPTMAGSFVWFDLPPTGAELALWQAA
jgi:hypothetical protein